MAKLVFTKNLQIHIEQPAMDFPLPNESQTTVGEILRKVFSENPRLAHYCVDDQGTPRNHIAIFVGGRPVKDRNLLSDIVQNDDEIYVMQALSGG